MHIHTHHFSGEHFQPVMVGMEKENRFAVSYILE